VLTRPPLMATATYVSETARTNLEAVLTATRGLSESSREYLYISLVNRLARMLDPEEFEQELAGILALEAATRPEGA
jgi:hypothetical protein